MYSGLENRFKEKLYGRIGVSFNPHGVPFTLGKYLKDRTNITLIDIGAHQGIFTTAIDRLCGVHRGVLVEPQPARAAQLRLQFLPPRFQVVQTAVSAKAGELELEINSFDATTSILKTKRDLPELAAVDVRAVAKVACSVATLDSVFRGAGFSHVDLLKLDVQGAEHLVISGGKETLNQTTMVWTEISFKRLYEGACLYNEVFDLLETAGFSLFELEPGFRGPRGELVQADGLFIKP
jgi:FkbM family methyltransferase